MFGNLKKNFVSDYAFDDWACRSFVLFGELFAPEVIFGIRIIVTLI